MKIGTTSWLLGEDYLANAQAVVGSFDFIELLVYTWNMEVQSRLDVILQDLLALDLEYSLHLPTDSVAHALAAADFFQKRGFPLLNMVLHPMPGWQKCCWPSLVSLENLVDCLPCYPRMTLDLCHAFLGQPFPDEYLPKVVEVHLSGVEPGQDHLPLNQQAMDLIQPFIDLDILCCLEIFSLEDALTACDTLKMAQD